jgi:hypothetical protein
MRLTPPSRNRLLVLLVVAMGTAVCLLWPKPPEETTNAPEQDAEAVRRWWSGVLRLAGGRGPGLADVTGTVRYKGKALGGGTIPFLGSDGAAYPARIGADGAYRVRVRVGDAQVLVSSIDEGRMVEHLQKLSDFTRGSKAGVAPESRSFSLIPEEYAAWGTSGLKVSIRGGKNTHDFDLP